MLWLRDFISPSNIWTAFQFCFPGAALIVSGWVSRIWELPPSVSALIALMTAACVIICLDFARSWFDRRNALLRKISELEETLRPKIDVVGITCPVTDYNKFERTIYIEIENDSGMILDNCLVQITEMAAFRSFGPDNKLSEWGPGIFKEHLPLTLKTQKNFERGGRSPFNLRAKQRKKLPICTRQDGDQTNLIFVDETGESLTISSFVSCDIEITIYGAPTPTTINVLVGINDKGEPMVEAR